MENYTTEIKAVKKFLKDQGIDVENYELKFHSPRSLMTVFFNTFDTVIGEDYGKAHMSEFTRMLGNAKHVKWHGGMLFKAVSFTAAAFEEMCDLLLCWNRCNEFGLVNDFLSHTLVSGAIEAADHEFWDTLTSADILMTWDGIMPLVKICRDWHDYNGGETATWLFELGFDAVANADLAGTYKAVIDFIKDLMNPKG